MGIAILMVIVYHAACCNLPMGALTQVANYGLIGVDIFMLFSAYGLCYSINKNKLSNFYKRRYVRVLPLYLVLVCSVLIHKALMGGVNLTDAVGASTTFFLWGLGDIFVDWYLTAILYFYLLFPLFYKVISKGGVIAYISLSVPFLLAAWYLPTTWFQDSALCRVPIFLAGILIYVAKKKWLAVSLILSYFFLLTCYSYVTGNVCLTYYVAPFVICLLMAFTYFVNKVGIIKAVLEYIGKHTLELYVANCIAMKIVSSVDGVVEKYAVYYGGILLLAFILGWLNNKIKRILES